MQGVEDIAIDARGPLLSYDSRFSKARPDSIVGHQGVALVVHKGGSLEPLDGKVSIEDADEVLVITALEVLDRVDQSKRQELTQQVTSLDPDFDHLLERHVKVHGEIFDRIWLRIGGEKAHDLPSETFLKRSRLGQPRETLLEKQFDAARYAILSSSGDLPPTLQGVWTGTWTPPWQSDYTQNGNVPSALASMMSANMPECMESYLGYMESLLPHFRRNAHRLYGCRGIMVPSRTSSHGYNTHFNEEYAHLFWTPGAAWAAEFFYDYYLYTGDQEFLRNRALPIMKEAALFYEDFLYEGKDGKLVCNPSYSPENTPANSDSQACINATMDIALIRSLLSNLIEVCGELETEEESVARWKSILQKLPEYSINDDGTLAEWTTSKLKDNHEHRHVSHLVAAFGALPDDIAGSPQLRRAFKKVIRKRMLPRREDGGGVMSFGLVQLGLAAASLGDSELAYETVELMSHAYWRNNLVSTHNPGEIFNVDICGGMPAVIIRMLVDSRVGRVDLLPALPDAWPCGEIGGVLCRGQIEIERLWWRENRVTVTMISAKEQRIELTLPGGIKSISVASGSSAVAEPGAPHGGHWIILPTGRPITIEIERES